MKKRRETQFCRKKGGFLKEIRKNGVLYVLMIPGLLYFFVFCYIPMGGLIIAFQDFNIIKGISNSDFCGLMNFKFLVSKANREAVIRVFRNTLVLNVLFIAANTFFSVMLALVFSEIQNRRVKKVMQAMSILPYFVSWAVISLILESFLKADGGIISTALREAGHPINFYSEPGPWPIILVIMKVWQGAGYGSIVYIATITGIDTEMYEAADIDGASKLQKTLYLTIPVLKPTIILMTLFSAGRIFYGDFGMIYGLVQDNALLFSTTDVIDTYVYRMLRSLSNYGMSTAVGMVQSAAGFIFVYIANYITRKLQPDAAIF